jgi:translation initiation factor 1
LGYNATCKNTRFEKEMGKKRDRRSLDDPEGGGFTMGDMLRAKGFDLSREDLPESPAQEAPAEGEGANPGVANREDTIPSLGGDLRLKLERKGRGGKKVTLLEGLTLQGKELERFVKKLRRGMGAGAKIEGDRVVVQGDLRERLSQWLEKQGAGRVRIL